MQHTFILMKFFLSNLITVPLTKYVYYIRPYIFYGTYLCIKDINYKLL